MDLIITLIIIGLLLLLVEILLIPGIGVAGILGVAALIASTWLSWMDFGMATGLIVASVNLVLIILLLLLALRKNTWKRFELKTNINSKVEAFKEGEIVAGDEGRTTTRLAPIGQAFIKDRNVECKSLEGMIDAGTDIVVVRIEDNQILVKHK